MTTNDWIHRYEKLREAYSKENEEICQILGKALDYPWFKDDQKNFPDATEDAGVCVGEHVASTIAEEAAKKICEQRAKINLLNVTIECFKRGGERQKRMIESVKEARDRYQAKAETLEMKLEILEAELQTAKGYE